jgi:hypothetical protein
MARTHRLCAAILGTNDSLVFVASLIIGVGTDNAMHKAMLVYRM